MFEFLLADAIAKPFYYSYIRANGFVLRGGFGYLPRGLVRGLGKTERARIMVVKIWGLESGVNVCLKFGSA